MGDLGGVDKLGTGVGIIAIRNARLQAGAARDRHRGTELDEFARGFRRDRNTGFIGVGFGGYRYTHGSLCPRLILE
jgi:hypothetical protein